MIFIIDIDANTKLVNTKNTDKATRKLVAFILIFLSPVICSFTLQEFMPGFKNEFGFTRAMLLLLPTWNLFLWVIKIKTTFFFCPAWIIFGIISIAKILSQS